ncbi:Sapep family Mn(2+)-dependent dipeptidase [Tepidanaerobacter sp. EBM-38]|uniref:Sapep family Mn(2+)-dependent dipeptidase n=1 Tax=Tepidanaerobacter sp. EBM-38 TaxID=1918496 RepID=UPI000AA16B7C|nr:Sapep family Mn(2+)-dependent dipeptidase [Tepidanaerobacter sp. EBM-38]
MLKNQIDIWIENNKSHLIEDIISLINIKSVKEPYYGKYPFGTGCGKVLDKALAMSEKYGFSTKNHQYYCGTAVLEGKTDKEIGIFTHLDVVPEGNGWEYSPYDAVVEKGYIIGRGSGDNKGPAMAALYAVRCLHELGIELNHSIRIFYGCDEETGMSDVKYYLDHHQAPSFSIVPDCAFSVCNGEKGILQMELAGKISDSNLKNFYGGTVSNMVPDTACAVLSCDDKEQIINMIAEQKTEGIFASCEGECLKITAKGVSGHAAFPEGTINAIQKLAAFLNKYSLVEENDSKVLYFIEDAFHDAYGGGLEIAYSDDISGKLTHVGSVAEMENGELTIKINIRYPITTDQENMIRKIHEVGNRYGVYVKSSDNNPPSYVSADSEAIQAMNDICNDVLNTDYEPYVMGGGTYARKLPRAVGYGPGILNDPSPFGTKRGNGHQPDECVKIRDLTNAIKIYVLALIQLDEILP